LNNLAPYIVVPTTGSKTQGNILLEFIRVTEERADVSVERVVGPPTNPRRLVIRASPSTIANLQMQFTDQLIIEPDSDLQMFT
jgi:hypothetical protein